jgi:hypothetical protein
MALGGLFPAGCVMPPAHSAIAGPDKPVGLNSLALPSDALCVMIEKCKNAVVEPVPRPGGFSGSQFRYTVQRAKVTEAAQTAPAKTPATEPEKTDGPSADSNAANRA